MAKKFTAGMKVGEVRYRTQKLKSGYKSKVAVRKIGKKKFRFSAV